MTLEEQLAAALASVKALEAKNAELLTEKAREKAKAEATEARLAALETAATAATEKLEAEAAKKAGDWEKREAQLTAKHDGEKAELNKQIATLNAARDKLVLGSGLATQLDAIGVKPEFKSAVEAMLLTANKGEVEIDSAGNFVGKIGGKPIADFVKEWAGTDNGKAFVASGHTGGDAPGGKDTKPAFKGNPYDRKAPNFTEQARLEKTNPTEAARLKAAAA